MDAEMDPRFKVNLSRIFSFFSSEMFLTKVGDMLDGGLRLSDETFDKLILLLDRRSIPILITILGYLDTISARKTIVNILGKIGMTDVPAVTRGLSDERWYVVRNIVIALRNIGDNEAKQRLLKLVSHKDARVRREVIKSLVKIGGAELRGILKQALDDPDLTIRQTALNSLSHLDEPLAKTLLIDVIRSSAFSGRDYEEKRVYYQALLKYDAEDVRRLLEKGLRKQSLFSRTMNDESKAAIAYSVGLLGDKHFLGCLYELVDSKTEILRQTAAEAIRKIEHGA
jgi:HEAT repeat protein